MVRKSKKELTTLAEATGGLAFLSGHVSRMWIPVCVQVARDIRNQYTLGYYPTNAAKDGTFPQRESGIDSAEGPRETDGSNAHRILRTEGLARRLVSLRAVAFGGCSRATFCSHSTLATSARKLTPWRNFPPKFSATVWPMSARVSRVPRFRRCGMRLGV